MAISAVEHQLLTIFVLTFHKVKAFISYLIKMNALGWFFRTL